MWWALSQLNPFGGGEENVKEEVVWGKFGKGREYVHMPLLEVRPLFSLLFLSLGLRVLGTRDGAWELIIRHLQLLLRRT